MADQFIKQRTAQVKMHGVADIVFCFDCTGSMTDIIKGVKENVDKLIDGFATFEGQLDWRARAMGYRDFDVDEEYLINDKPFVSTVDELRAQIEGIKAVEYTGGDDAESTLDAIWYAAKRSEWREGCHKIVIVFTDDIPKPLSQKTVDDIKGADPSIAVLAQELNVMHIKLFLWGKKDPAYDDLERIPRADIVQMENPEKDVENMDFNRLMETIGKTISQLVSSGQATA